jgi:hypothetical protein
MPWIPLCGNKCTIGGDRRDLLTMAKATKRIHQVNRTMKKTAIAVAAALVALVNSVNAKLGETPAELMARYGQMTNPFGLMLGMGEWKVKDGGEVNCIFSGGVATLMIYTGKIDIGLRDQLMNRNLPAGQKWMNSSDAKSWFATAMSRPDIVQMPEGYIMQTTDGNIWAIYVSGGAMLAVGTKAGFETWRGLGGLKEAKAEASPSPTPTEKAENFEAQCRAIAKREWPDDFTMQRFVYNQQLAAARYMQSSNVTDAAVKATAIREWPNDFTMQRFVYNQQVAAKTYMKSLEN